MSYASQEDLENRFGATEILQLSDRDDSGEADAEVISAVLASADSLIDGYVAKRYGLPLSETPPLLNTLAGDIARYQLYLAVGGVPDPVKDAYDIALRQLRDIADGRLVLDIDGDEPPGTGGNVQVTSRTRVMRRDHMDGF